MKVSAPITSARFTAPVRRQRVGRGEAVGEAGADGLEVEGHAAADAELALDRRCRGREGEVRRGGGDQHEVDLLRRQLRPLERHPCGGGGEVGGELALGRHVALAYARPLADPRVGGL